MGIFFMLTWSPCSGSRFQCMFVWTGKDSAKGIPFWGRRDVICWAWSHVSIAGCEILGWPWLIIPNSKHTWVSVCCSYRVCIHIGLRDDFGFSLTSLKAAPVQLSVWQNLQHGSLRLTCARLRALGPCLLGDALLCGHHSQSCCRKHPVEAVFAGTGRADGGARRRWGCPWRHESRHLHHWHHRAWDCILVCQHQRLLQPMRNMRRPESGSGHDIEVFSLLTSEGSICCPWQSRSPCDLGRHSVFEGTNADRQWACFPCWYVLLAVGPGFSACLFGLQKLQPKESHVGNKRRYLLGLITCEHRRMWDTWVTLADNSQFKTYMGVSVLFLSSLYSHRTPRWFWLQLDLFEGRSCAALCVAKLATWLAPPHVCSLACSWPLPARRCFALWAPLPVLLQEAPRWSSLCGHRPCRWRREAAVRVPLATWVPTLTSLASPCLGLHPCLPTSAASSTHEKTWEDQRVAAAMI